MTIKYFDEEWPKEEEILNIGMKMSKQNKRDRMKRVFLIGNGTSRKDFDLEKLRPFGKIYACNAIYRDGFRPDVLVAVDHGIMHEIYNNGIADEIPCYFRDWTRVPEAHYEMMKWSGLNLQEREKVKEFYDDLNENEKGDRKEFVMHGMNMAGKISVIRRYENKPGDPENNKKIIKKEIDHSDCRISWVHDDDKAHNITDFYKDKTNFKKDRGWAAGPTSGMIALVNEEPDEVYLIGHDIKSNDNFVNNLFAGTKHYVAPENAPTPGVNWEQQWCNLIKEFPKTKFIKVNPNADRGPDKVSQPVKLWSTFVGKNVFYTDYPGLAKMVGL